VKPINPIEPMLAAPESQLKINDWTQWCIEQKYDGHRMIIYRVTERQVKSVYVFARPRGDGRMIERTYKLSRKLIDQLLRLPPGIYDGELLGGDTGTDVSRLDLIDDLYMVIFDVLDVEGQVWMDVRYSERRTALQEIFRRLHFDQSLVQLAASLPLETEKEAKQFVKKIWTAGGEGAILKWKDGLYLPNKRKASHWVKIKRKESAALTVIGFQPSRGAVRFPGHPFAIVQLRDKDGNETTVKTLNDDELKKFETAWFKLIGRNPNGPILKAGEESMLLKHPAIGKTLWVEFPRRTRTGGYQGPVIWDHFDDE
jgi:ATP-dependent DNA ligase